MKKIYLLLVFLVFSMVAYGQINSMAIVGEAASGWPGSPTDPGPIDLHQMTSSDGENWFLPEIVLTNSVSGGGIKFRANNEWLLNWGAIDFPSGVGAQFGPNIPCSAGTYEVSFNSTTGVYSFNALDPTSSIVKLVGTAVNSSSGVLLTSNDGVNYNLTNIDLTSGTAQFEVNGDLFGGTQFPLGVITGTAQQIPVVAGNYSSITLNLATGEYNFVVTPVFPLISLTGSAVGGSGDGFDIDMTTTDGIHYFYTNLGTINGELKFRSNHAWTLSYGANSFPEGTAIVNGPAIPVPLGTWNVAFNLQTGVYSFTGNSNFPTISLVGSGAGGWPSGGLGETDNNQMTTSDGINYTIYAVAITDGELKFRQNNDWSINWGFTDFPVGIALQNGPNIISTTGTYTVQFNRISGEYLFENPNRIAIVGSGVGGWPTGAAGEIDANQLTSTDGISFRVNNITLTDGFVKFRQNNSWDVNWGGTSLFGTLVVNGPNIPTTAGNYSIEMNRVTGTYAFAAPLGTIAVQKVDLKIYPNPSQNVWNVTSANEAITSIQIVDVVGKTVMTVAPQATSAVVDGTALNSGIYFARIATATATSTIKLVRN
jgi:hypothetical protein